MDNFKKLSEIIHDSKSWADFKAKFTKEFPKEKPLSEFAKKIEKAINYNPKENKQ